MALLKAGHNPACICAGTIQGFQESPLGSGYYVCIDCLASVEDPKPPKPVRARNIPPSRKGRIINGEVF